MNSTYFSSLSGMLAASYGLQNTSNNVANLQSPGFKRTDVFYSSLGNGGSQDSLGSGVTVGGHMTNFSAGSYHETGKPADLAIVGDGFFIIKLNIFCFKRNIILFLSYHIVKMYNRMCFLITLQYSCTLTYVQVPCTGSFLCNILFIL